jgi:tRNA A-37 threonylcarbamoyl transferase component Bud32
MAGSSDLAEVNIKVGYSIPALKVGYTIMCVLFPLWTIAMPIGLGIFLGQWLCYPNRINALLGVLCFLSLTAAILLGFCLTALTDETNLQAGKYGISFPFMFLTNLKFKRNWLWQDLQELDLAERAGQQIFRIRLNNGTADFDLRYLAKSQLEEFLLACDLWASECKKSIDVLDMQKKLQNRVEGENRSYTEMWEDELNRRFHPTAFIPLDAGTKLQKQKYSVVRQLAFGGFSAIYLAQQEDADLVVLKESVVPENVSPEARSKSEELINRESQILFCLYHPSIARVLDYFVEERRHYVVLEYVRGQDLKQLVRQKGPQAQTLVIEWALQIAAILEFLHGQKPPIIHRDLTPDNLILKNDGTIALIDFGVANEFLGTVTGTMVGKQAYIAPEQLRGKAKPLSDLYAFGGTLNFLLTGIDPRPLSEANPSLLKPELLLEFSKLVGDLTKLDESKRIASAEDVTNRLKQIKKIMERQAEEQNA